MTEFRSWRERVAAAAGAVPNRIRYTRKSTESLDRQIASHEQQAAEADEMWGPLAPEWWWMDNYTGTTFERPAFKDMLEFCREHPRPESDPGRIEIYDPSRFGRCLNKKGQPDIMRFLSVSSQFQSYNWNIEFVTIRRTGDQLIDIIMMALYAYAAAVYSMNLSKNVRRGRVDHASKGWWTSGTAPWGTVRKDTQSGRVLAKGQRSTPGGGGTILVPDPDVLPLWHRAAKRIMGGAPLDAVGSELFEKGLRGPRDGKFGHRSVRNFLTNRALIGEVEYLGAPDNGKRERKHRKANWPPMVDVDLFHQVSKRLSGHSRAEKPRQRKRRELYPLTPACAHCGGEYNGGRLSAAQGASRGYVHAKPRPRMDEEGHKRFVEQGCKVWYIDAEELETKIKDLIVSQRSSEEFESLVRELILERDTFRKRADEAVEAARMELQQRQAGYKKLASLTAQLADVDGDSVEEDPLVERLTAAKQAVKAAKAKLEEAERFAISREDAWERLAGIINETRNLAAVWDKAGPEERKILLDYWVLDVLIVIEPVPGMKRANRKTAVVSLRIAPNAPAYFDLGGDRPPRKATAADSSSPTAWSVSTADRALSAASASADPSLPSAHAACRRTSGSSAESAPASAGTSSGEPTLPSTTAELRFNPRSLARFMGEPLNAAENSGCDMASSSRASDLASLPDSAERAENAGSDSSFANLWLYGHTS